MGFKGRADLVKEQLVKKNVTQSELARRMGTSKQNLFKKIKGNTLSDSDIKLIEKALDVKFIQCFLDETNSKVTEKNLPEKNAYLSARICITDGNYNEAISIAQRGLDWELDSLTKQYLNLVISLAYAHLYNTDKSRVFFNEAKKLVKETGTKAPLLEYQKLLRQVLRR